MDIGKLMHQWATDLFPINRSLTGEGVKQTLAYIKDVLPELEIQNVPTGYKAFDWEVPNEWNITEAFIENEAGERIIDFNNNNLHVVGYSVPVDIWLSREGLEKNIYTLPEQPDAIPYVTSYYKERWGFCMTHEQKLKLPDGKYHAVIKSELKPGVLNFADLVIPGKTDEEVIFSTYVCHPSMGNNELSGPVLAMALANELSQRKNLKYTYRFIFAPETLGAIVYLSKNIQHLKKHVISGFILTCVGDERAWSFLPSRKDGTLTDRVSRFVLKDMEISYKEYSFLQRGSDERQYCAPGVDLPFASVMRSKYGTYPEYHTSKDDLNLISPKGLAQSFELYKKIIKVLECNFNPMVKVLCEPQLGPRGLYPNLSVKGGARSTRDMMNVIAYSDGEHDLIDLFEKTGIGFDAGIKIVNDLIAGNVLE